MAISLSVLVPVYNEERTVGEVLRRLVDGPYPDKQIIVVDDGSRDHTPEVLAGWARTPGLVLCRHARNRGKGAAVRTALAQAHGDIVVIQDADLEYDPADLPRLVEALGRDNGGAVYGSRYLAPAGPLPWTKYRLAVLLVNGLVYLLYGRRLTDEATCYKACRTATLRQLDLQSEHFELCAEITAKLCRRGLPLVEVPISYQPRTAHDGKKIGWRDAWQTVWALVKWRFARYPGKALPAPQLTPIPFVIGRCSIRC